VQASQQRVKAYGSVAGHQAGRFTTHTEPLHDIPPDPPDAGFFSRARTGFGLWGTDPATTKAKYQQQDQKNKQQYRGYAEGGYGGREYGGARPGRGSGDGSPRGAGARSGVGRNLGEHPSGDAAPADGQRYRAGSTAREGGIAPMAGGAGARGEKDRERRSPDYLRGNYLDPGTPAYDEHGFAIMPPSGLVEDWLAENGFTDR
jgi:hypothetical protein